MRLFSSNLHWLLVSDLFFVTIGSYQSAKTQHFYNFFIYSANGKQALLGMENGAIRIHSLDTEGAKQERIPDDSQADFSTFGPHWSLTVHDNDTGVVSAVKRSFDGRFVFTAGRDGNLFAFELLSQEKIDEAKALAKAKLPSARVRLKTR